MDDGEVVEWELRLKTAELLETALFHIITERSIRLHCMFVFLFPKGNNYSEMQRRDEEEAETLTI